MVIRIGITTSQENNVASAVQTITVLPQAPTLTAGSYFADSKSVTIAKADGEDAEATISYKIGNGEWIDYTEALNITETSTVYAKVVQGGLESAEISATYTKFVKSDLVSVSAAKTWTIPTSLTLELTDDGTTFPAKYDEYYTYADIATINGHDLGTFDGTTLAFSGQFPYRGNNGSQNGNLQFITSVPGKVTVEFSNTGGSNKERWIKVNDTTGSVEADGTTKRTEDFTVSAGTVTITHVDKDGNLSKGLRIYSITFTPATENVTVSSAEYATFAPVNKVAVPDGVKAYIVSETSASSVTLEEVEVIPAGTPVIVYKEGADNTEVTFTATAAVASDVSDNQLQVSDTPVTADGTQYVLAQVNDVVGFHKVTAETTIAAGKAYLVSPAGANFLRFDFEDDVITNIRSIENGQLTNDNVYNLAGQRVAVPTKGLYIVNGKKVVLK